MCWVFLLCNVTCNAIISFDIILLRKRGLVALLTLCFAVMWLSVFCVSSAWCVSLSVIAIFPGHAHSVLIRLHKIVATKT